MALITVPIDDLKTERGIAVPAYVGFRQIIVTGPPDCGKSTLVRNLGGWPEEGYLDVAEDRWWLSRLLTLRPREVHLGLPFTGHLESHSVFDEQWLSKPTDVELSRIVLPPPKRGLFSVNWRNRYAFDFQLPALEEAYMAATGSARSGKHPGRFKVERETIARQIAVHEQAALHFHRNGMIVYVRLHFQGPPFAIVDEVGAAI